MNIGIFIPNWIGDAAMCTPALRALARGFPNARLVGVMRPYVADVLAGNPRLDETILFHHKASNPAERTRNALHRMRQEHFDAVVLFTNSLRSASLAWASGATTRVGFVRNGRGPLLTHKLYPARTGWLGMRRLPSPAIDAYLQLVYALGCQPESHELELATLPEDERAADAVWEKWNLPPGDQVVLINSSGAYGAAKLWPSDYFAELARRLAARKGLAVLVACGPKERETARRIVRQADHPRVVSLADEPISLGLTKACVRRSRLMVTTDSGPRFFAVAFGVPVVTLFGPTDMAWTLTHSKHETCLHHAVPCGPCGKRECPLVHHDCMRLLSVDRVFQTVAQQLDVRRPDAA